MSEELFNCSNVDYPDNCPIIEKMVKENNIRAEFTPDECGDCEFCKHFDECDHPHMDDREW